MRKQFVLTVRARLVAELRGQRIHTNLEKDEVALASIQQIRGTLDLPAPGQMNKAFRIVVLGLIGTDLGSIEPSGLRHDVKHDLVHQLDLIAR